MFFSNYLSRKSEIDSLKIDMAREKLEIETEPEEEKNEMKAILSQEGYDAREVEVIMGRLEKNNELWLKETLRREVKVNPEDLRQSPYTSPILAGLAFFLLALLAVVPYAFNIGRNSALLASIGLSIVALFALGSRALVPRNFRPVAGLESALIGALAGGLLYFLGILISRL